MNLLKNASFGNIVVETTAGTTDVSPLRVFDMQGYEGICFIGQINAVTAAGLLQMSAAYSDSTSTTDLVTDTGTAVGSTSTTTDMDDKLLVLDIYKPLKRYVGVHIDRATQASEINVVGIQYGARKGPVSQSTDQYGVYDSDVDVSPTT